MAFTQPIIGSDIESNSIERIHLADNSVGPSEIGPDSIESVHVSNSAITAPKIAAYAVTAAKLAVEALDFWTARGMRLVSGSLETNDDPLLGVKVADDAIRIYDTAKRLVAQLSSTIGSSDLFVDHIWIKNVLFSLNESINEFSLYNAAYDASIKLGMGSTALDRSNLLIAMNQSANNIILSIKNVLTEIRLESGGVRIIGDMIRLSSGTVYMSDLPESAWNAVTPIFSDSNGRLFKWTRAPQRPLYTTFSIPNGTVIAAGNYYQKTVTYSANMPDGTPNLIIANLASYPGGSSYLVPRVNNISATSAVVRIVNVGSASTTLSGALGVGVSIIP